MNIFGMAKSLINPMSLMQLAMGPAGWASLAMKTIGSQIAMQVIQKLGQELGLPPAAINLAQSAFASASGQPGLAQQNIRETIGGIVRDLNLSAMDQGKLERAVEFDIQNMLKDLVKAAKNGNDKAERGRGDKGGSFMRRIAEAMALVMDGQIKEMEGLAKKMDAVKHDKVKTDSTQIQTDLTVATQEFNMTMQATSNMIKTIGEGLAAMARKN